MRVRVVALALLGVLAGSAHARAQSQTGEVFGKVTDASGAVLPGATVTLTGPVLLQPLTAVTGETGTYQFPRIEIGVYSVRFDLTGFKTIVHPDIRVTVGFSAQVNAQLPVSTVEETVTVTGESPVVDTKDTGTKQTFTNELLQSIPSARDPWVILQQTAGVAMDRENVGGNMSGQQSNYVSRGGNPFNNKWSLDGVDITDMSATGASPSYYDFDAFEEMTITTGGVDVTQQTGGVGINLVTKSGTDRFKGSTRFYETDQKFESQNIDDAQRKQGATSGNPIQNIKDYGFELGGPLKKGKAWVWGSFGKQNIGVGVLNFYQPTTGCQAIKADEAGNPLAHSITDVNNCLNTDLTVLTTTNLKAEVQLFKGNKLTLFNNFAKKERNARGASDLNPIETTTPQGAVPSTYGFGKSWWTIGPNPTYKAGDQWVLSDRLLLDVTWAHIGNNFILDFHDPSLAVVQPTLVVATGLNGRSGSQSIFIRPVQSVDLNMNYFMPAVMGGDHAFKIGGHWRDSYSFSQGHTGGNATARFPTSINDDCAAIAAANPTNVTKWCQANLTRDSQTQYDLLNWTAFAQDTFTHNRLTLQLGVRYDYNHDQALASVVGANPLFPDWLPGINFAGADPKVAFNNLSPRLGFTYDLTGNGKTIARANYARYYGQVGTGGVSFQINPVTAASVRFPWNDANHDGVIQPSEVLTGLKNVTSFSGNYDPSNPSFLGTANTVDPNLKNDSTDEFILGVDREIGAGFAAGINYIWRRYANFQFADTLGLEPTDYSPVAFTPSASACPAGAACQQVTYYQPNFLIPGVSNLTNFTSDQYNRTYNGVEVTARKRMSHHWLMTTSYAYNSTIVNMNGFAGDAANGLQVTGTPEDPTNRTQRNGGQYDFATSGSGIGNVYVNAKWLYKLSGLFQLPGDVNVSGFYNARQGYPFERFVQSPNRPNGAGVISVFIDSVGASRLPNYQNLDFHVERPFKFGQTRWIPALDIFNVMNSNTVQAIRGTQNASNANNLQALLAPRVMRLGIRVNW
jgi:hypothetical protein